MPAGPTSVPRSEDVGGDSPARVGGCWNSPHQSSGAVRGQPPSSGRTITADAPSAPDRRTVAVRGGNRWHSPRLVPSLSQLSQNRHSLHCSMLHLVLTTISGTLTDDVPRPTGMV